MPYTSWITRKQRLVIPETCGITKNIWQKIINETVSNDRFLAQFSSETCLLAADESPCREPQPDTMRRESNLEVYLPLAPLHLEIGEFPGRWKGNTKLAFLDENSIVQCIYKQKKDNHHLFRISFVLCHHVSSRNTCYRITGIHYQMVLHFLNFLVIPQKTHFRLYNPYILDIVITFIKCLQYNLLYPICAKP